MSALKKQIIKLLEISGIFRFLAWRNRYKPLILMYHRITNTPHTTGITPDEFEQQIRYLSSHFRIVPTEQLLAEVAQNNIQPYTLSLTFDDGHADFYKHAWPLLKKYKLPASLYITTGFVDGNLWLWPDYLKYILINSRVDSLSIAPLGQIPITQDMRLSSWHKLGDYCLTLAVDDRNQFLANLADAAEVYVGSQPREPFTAVTWPQLQEMYAEGLDVGSHTVSHPILSKLSDADIRTELMDSATAIEAHLGKRPLGLCYPNGRPEDIDQRVLQQAQQAGYAYGLLGRNLSITKYQPFLVGRLAANINFNYFKWTLVRRQKVAGLHYLN